MIQPFDIEVQFYSPAGLNRGVDPAAIGNGVEWELLEMGGMGQATIPLHYGFDAASLPTQTGDTAKIWVSGETYPRYIGEVSKPDRSLSTTESRSLVLFGEMERANRIRAEKRIVFPGGADLALFGASLLDLYEAKRGIKFGRDFQTTGVLLEMLDAQDSFTREAFDKLLSQAPGAAVWGWEVNPASGVLTCYIRPRIPVVGWSFPVGENVALAAESIEMADLVNRMKLRGGDAKYPNILAAAVNGNTSFEHPIVANDTVGNVLADPSLEVTTITGQFEFWQIAFGGGVSHQAHTGTTSAFLFQAGATLIPAFPDLTPIYASVVAGHAYRFGAWSKLEATANLVQATGTLQFYDDSLTPVGGPVTILINPPDQSWTQFWEDVIAPGGATRAQATYALTAVSGGKSIFLDDLTLSDVTQVEQDGWESFRDGTAVVNLLNWAYDGITDPDGFHEGEAAFEGAYSAYLSCQASGPFNDVSLRPINNARMPVQGGRQYRFGVWVKSPPGETATPQFCVRLGPKDATGADADGITEYLLDVPLSGSPILAWALISVTQTMTNSAVTCEFSLIVRSNGALLFDAPFCRDQQYGIAPGSPGDWITGDKFERTVNVQDVCPPTSPVYNSQAVYGLQEQVVQNDQVLTWDADAIAWVIAYLEIHAKLTRRPRIELTHEPVQIVSPGAGLQVRLTGLAESFGDEWPSRVLYRFAGGSLGVNIEEGDEEPKLSRLLSRVGLLFVNR